MTACKDKRSCMFKCIVMLVLALDQLTKLIAQRYMPSGSGFFSFNYTTNTGAAFGMLKDSNVFLIIISFIVLAAIIYFWFYHSKKISRNTAIFSALLFGGVLGNLLDRLFRGFVVDFIDFSFWPAFNAADIAITVGVGGLVWIIWREE